MDDTKRKDVLEEASRELRHVAQEIRELRGACEELASELLEARAQRDGLRNLLGSVYRRLRDGREVSLSQMEALRICYDRRHRALLLPHAEDPTDE